MKECDTCGRFYNEKSFNDRVWHREEWGCRQRIKEGLETNKVDKIE